MACRHAFHKECVDKWLETGKNNCPACRSRVCRYIPAHYPILIFRCRAYLRKVVVLLSHDFYFFFNGHCLVNHVFCFEIRAFIPTCFFSFRQGYVLFPHLFLLAHAFSGFK